MNLFKNYTYSWKQIGVFKVALLTIGALLGAYFNELVSNNMTLLISIATVATVYTMYVSFSQ